jgi:hypothetical protein
MSEIFKKLNAINVNENTEKKNGLTYLSWAWAWAELKKAYPDATYKIRQFDGKPYLYDENLGYMVMTEITIDNITHEMWLPVMDSANNAMKSTEYTKKNKYKEVPVLPATMFDINTAIMRCLTKNIAMFGLGLYIYAGEDLPEEDVERQQAEAHQREVENAKISEVKVKALLARCKAENVEPEKICYLYKVKSLADLTELRHRHIANHWQDIKDAKYGD